MGQRTALPVESRTFPSDKSLKRTEAGKPAAKYLARCCVAELVAWLTAKSLLRSGEGWRSEAGAFTLGELRGLTSSLGH